MGIVRNLKKMLMNLKVFNRNMLELFSLINSSKTGSQKRVEFLEISSFFDIL